MSTTSIETAALNKLSIIDRFNFGHNLLRSPTTLEQLYSQLTEVLTPVVLNHSESLSDINISVYSAEAVMTTKVNICWYKISDSSTYFILMNPYVGSAYVELTTDTLNQLLLNGKLSSGWYLLNQIDCLQSFISNASTTVDIDVFFAAIITKIVTTIFDNHESDYSINGHYTSQFASPLTNISTDIDAIINTIQIKSSSISDDSGGASYIYSDTATVSTHTNAVTLTELTYAADSIPNIVSSEYLNSRSDVAAFLINTTKQTGGCNIRFFFANVIFKNLDASKSIQFTDTNYSITTQLIGTFTIKYSDGSTVKIPPTCQAIPISKTADEIFFVVMLYSSNYLTKTISSIDADSVTLLYTLKGALNDTTS